MNDPEISSVGGASPAERDSVRCDAWMAEEEAALMSTEWWAVVKYSRADECWFELRQRWDTRELAEAAGRRAERSGYVETGWRVMRCVAKQYAPKPSPSAIDESDRSEPATPRSAAS